MNIYGVKHAAFAKKIAPLPLCCLPPPYFQEFVLLSFCQINLSEKKLAQGGCYCISFGLLHVMQLIKMLMIEAFSHPFQYQWMIPMYIVHRRRLLVHVSVWITKYIKIVTSLVCYFTWWWLFFCNENYCLLSKPVRRPGSGHLKVRSQLKRKFVTKILGFFFQKSNLTTTMYIVHLTGFDWWGGYLLVLKKKWHPRIL